MRGPLDDRQVVFYPPEEFQWRNSKNRIGELHQNGIFPLFSEPSAHVAYPTAKQCTVVPGSGVVPNKETNGLLSKEKDPPWLGPEAGGPIHRVVHPQGFRILKNRSVLERTLRGYFRLPPIPSDYHRQERDRIRKAFELVEKQECERWRRRRKNARNNVLDGALLLNAAGTNDPEEVKAVTLECSYLTSSAPEELAFFTKLAFLDVSENSLNVEDLLSLTSLETLHIACNKISSLAGMSRVLQEQQQRQQDSAPPEGIDSSPSATATLTSTKSLTLHDVLLPNLNALNLSYNRIPASHLSLLAHFPCLEKLDLSGNEIQTLPADLSFLTGVTHLALENNRLFSSLDEGGATNVFHSLSTMPSLLEVNLNYNQLSYVPPLSMRDGHGLCFPSIEIIGISNNQFKSAEDLVELGHLHRTLRQIVLLNNPICIDSRQIETLKKCFLSIAESTFYEHKNPHQGWDDILVQPNEKAARPDTSALCVENDSQDWKDRGWTRLISTPKKDGGHFSLQRAARAAAAAAAAETASLFPSSRKSSTTEEEDQGERCVSPTCFSRQFCANSTRMRQSCFSDPDKVTLRLGNSAAVPAGVVLPSRASFTNVEAYLHAYEIKIIVEEHFMPKQTLGYFYATHTCRAGNHALVTVPSQKEFMDIYRLARPKQRRAHRSSFSPPKASIRASDSTCSPTGATEFVQKSDCDNNTTVAGKTHTFTAVEELSGQDRVATFFMTEMENPTTSDPRTSQAASAPSSVCDFFSLEEPKHGRAEPKPQKCRLPSVISPSSVNVHRALAELKSLLRKPLPSLPYSSRHR